METFLKPAILASIPLGLINFTTALGHAVVNPFILNCPLEKTFAPENVMWLNSSCYIKGHNQASNKRLADLDNH